MYKLVILIEPLDDWASFETQWPRFLHLVESLDGLRREATGRVQQFLFGRCPVAQTHELYFDSYAELEQALSSAPGQEAGRLIQQITGGRLSLFIAEHKEDDMVNILKYRKKDDA